MLRKLQFRSAVVTCKLWHAYTHLLVFSISGDSISLFWFRYDMDTILTKYCNIASDTIFST